VTGSSLGGRLLVATPVIGDPNFERTVVFLIDHSEDGAMGVVVNRPTDIGVGGSLPQWEPMTARPPVVFLGGPVEQDAAIGLARPQAGAGADPDDGDPWRLLRTEADSVGLLATVDLDAAPAAAPGLDAVRVYVGYAGWGPGQLEHELAQEAWITATARPSDLWSPAPDRLWAEVLRRQRGTAAWLSLYPRDPSGN
jgi:putative transcriptional regulator